MSESISLDTVQPKNRLRSIIGGSAGNLVEWYDWYVYAAFTLYFAKSFFPEGDQTAQLLSAAAVFAVGFLARPVGAWLMGLYADRRGRKAALTLSVALMCGGSLIIALLSRLRHHRRRRAGHPGAGPAAAGPQPRRRVRRQRHLPVGDGRRPSGAASGRASSTSP